MGHHTKDPNTSPLLRMMPSLLWKLLRLLHVLVSLHNCSAWVPSSWWKRVIGKAPPSRRLASSRLGLAANENSPVQGITLKIAVDSQGGVVDLGASSSDRFTSAASLDRVHRLRRESQAILIGRGTVAFDNPSLTIRRNVTAPPQPPLRVVLDSRLGLLIERMQAGRMYQLLEDGRPTLIYHALEDVDEETLNMLETTHLVQVPMTSETDSSSKPSLDVTAIWKDLQDHWGVTHLMVEGGPATAQSFLQAGLVDRVIFVKALGIAFREPIPSGITTETLQAANLKCLGSFDEQGDTTECWVRPGDSWPTRELTDWP